MNEIMWLADVAKANPELSDVFLTKLVRPALSENMLRIIDVCGTKRSLKSV